MNYKLDENHVPVPVGPDDYSGYESDRAVDKTTVTIDGEEVRISTVFLVVNYGIPGGPLELFETMIFGGKHDMYQERYTTWDDAVDGHKYAVELAKGQRTLPED